MEIDEHGPYISVEPPVVDPAEAPEVGHYVDVPPDSDVVDTALVGCEDDRGPEYLVPDKGREAAELPGEDQPQESHPVLDRKQFLELCDRIGISRPGYVFNALVRNRQLVPRENYLPLPPSEQLAHHIVNRDGVEEWVVSVPNAERHLAALGTGDYVGTGVHASVSKIVAALGAGAISGSPQDAVEVTEPTGEGEPHPLASGEHHPVLDMTQFEELLKPFNITLPRDLFNILGRNAALNELYGKPAPPLPPSEQLAHYIVNRDGQREWVLSVPNIQQQLPKLNGVHRMGKVYYAVVQRLFGPDAEGGA